MLYLDEKPLKGYNHNISISNRIEREELTGSQTSTLSSFKGIKPKVMQVTFNIRFEDENHLKEINALFEGIVNGAPKIYTISEPAANAIGMNYAAFSENLDIKSLDPIKAWGLSFTLIESHSNAEKRKENEVADSLSVTNTPAQNSQDVGISDVEKQLDMLEIALENS